MAVLALAYVGTVAGFLRFIDRERDRTDAREQKLLNRVQAPAHAVADTVEPDDSPQFIRESDEDRRFEHEWEAELN